MQDDALLAAALSSKALTIARQALTAAQAAETRQAPDQVDVAALLAGFARALAKLQINAPAVSVSAADAPVINVAPAAVTVEGATMRFDPQITIDVPAQAAPIVNIEPAAVNVGVEAPIVHVAAPVVHVAAPAGRDPVSYAFDVQRAPNGLISLVIARPFIEQPVTTPS
jgi:hypothetical protein